jgi:predicted GIY-YIG superfamily endonuclease
MSTKKVNYKKEDIENLPNDKPVVYKILSKSDENVYTGSAKRGRVNERIEEHIGVIPGSKVVIEQFSSIDEAREREVNIISRSKPRYNKAGK